MVSSFWLTPSILISLNASSIDFILSSSVDTCFLASVFLEDCWRSVFLVSVVYAFSAASSFFVFFRRCFGFPLKSVLAFCLVHLLHLTLPAKL